MKIWLICTAVAVIVFLSATFAQTTGNSSQASSQSTPLKTKSESSPTGTVQSISQVTSSTNTKRSDGSSSTAGIVVACVLLVLLAIGCIAGRWKVRRRRSYNVALWNSPVQSGDERVRDKKPKVLAQLRFSTASSVDSYDDQFSADDSGRLRSSSFLKYTAARARQQAMSRQTSLTPAASALTLESRRSLSDSVLSRKRNGEEKIGSTKSQDGSSRTVVRAHSTTDGNVYAAPMKVPRLNSVSLERKQSLAAIPERSEKDEEHLCDSADSTGPPKSDVDKMIDESRREKEKQPTPNDNASPTRSSHSSSIGADTDEYRVPYDAIASTVDKGTCPNSPVYARPWSDGTARSSTASKVSQQRSEKADEHDGMRDDLCSLNEDSLALSERNQADEQCEEQVAVCSPEDAVHMGVDNANCTPQKCCKKSKRVTWCDPISVSISDDTFKLSLYVSTGVKTEGSIASSSEDDGNLD